MKAIYLLICSITYTTILYGQDIPLTGNVTDEEGNPLPGVSVLIKGSQQGSQTDTEGNYSFEAPGNAILVFQFLGYTTREIPREGRNTVNVRLAPDNQQLEEIVVIGYGTQRAGDVTSAVASVKSEDFVKGAVRDAAQLIQGKVAGLGVSTPSGDPTEGTLITLRGITTIQSSSNPLVLIDGIPGDLNTVAPEDIESIDILKDGSAAAIYGTRGTNGVILITTRQYKGERRSSIEYNGYLNFQTIASEPDFLNAGDYRRLIEEGVDFNDYGTSTNWLDEIMHTPVSQNHNLSFQGGTAATNFIASVNYKGWEGIFLNSDNQQITARATLNHSMFDGRLRANLNIVARNRKYWTGGDGASFNDFVYRQALIRNPTDSIRDYKGDWKEDLEVYMYENPLAWLNESYGENSERELRLNGSLTFSPIENLDMKLLLSGVKYNEIRGYAETKDHASNTFRRRNGYASRGTSSSIDNLLEFTADYSADLNGHRFSFLAGYSYQEVTDEGYWMQNWDFPTDNYSYNRMESGDALVRGEAIQNSDKSAYKLIGFFGRVNYNWDDKYLLMASIRQEGSSKFGANHKWGTFPAISLGWRLNKESFLENAGFINDLKIRAGYGVTGTAPGTPYLSLTSLNYEDKFLYDGQWVQGLTPVRNPNPDLRWEKKEEYNIGLDFSLLENKVTGSVDIYRRNTKDMLYDYPVPVPPYLYGSITANVGQMRNEGVEVLVNTVPLSGTLQWNSGITWSTNRNELVSIENEQFQLNQDWFQPGEGHTGEPIQQFTHIVRVGEPIGNFYGWKSVDIDEDGVWIVEDANGERISMVDAKPEDRQVLGNGLPKHYLGWNNTFRYKNFDLAINMRGAFGFQLLNFQRMYYENPTITQYNMLHSAFDPVYGKTRLNYDLSYVSYYIEDGDYWKIDNVTLGYTFNLQNNKVLKHARLYLSALNLVTITGYKGIDPEGVPRTGLAPGNDYRDKYPTTTTFTAGVNLTF